MVDFSKPTCYNEFIQKIQAREVNFMKKNIQIFTDRVIGRPNPRMWGIFVEDINHAGDGGLYAELIRNRNFADSAIPENTVYADGKFRTPNGYAENFNRDDLLPGWSLKSVGESFAHMDLTKENPRNPECPYQLKLGVIEPGDGVMVVNQGFWGICAKKQQYYGFIIARAKGISSITVGLMYSNGIEICSQKLAVGEAFEKMEYRLDCPVEADDARFFVKATEPGVLWIDFVSLFPQDTDQNRPYGFRKDIMDMIRALRPGFLRYPGGCVVEGITLANAFLWKKTRGPIEDRPGHWSLWGYRATDGLGMYEFCQLAEDLNAEIIYVVNCGMSCQGRKSQLATEEEIEWWIQNALDGIAYICEDKSTEFGALRALDGHPDPFPLKYVEIGNENYGPEYHERYKKFYQAIKARYPQLTIIANQAVPDAPVEMIDEHHFTHSQEFPNRFSHYEGEGTPIYVGEYATAYEVENGHLLSAISDAVFLTGLENACNRVRLVSYAPLLYNENNRRWAVNLIGFNNDKIYGIPSYYVQKLFAENPVDEVYATDCQPTKDAESSIYVTAGKKDNKLIIKAVNFGDGNATVAFDAKEKYTAKEAWMVASENIKDTNSLVKPHKVEAIPVPLDANNKNLQFNLPPYSFIVIVAE